MPIKRDLTPLDKEFLAREKGYDMPKDKMDKVDDDELEKDFDDREDKDIDNDGEVDDEDEYLHNRRKKIDKAIKEAFDRL